MILRFGSNIDILSSSLIPRRQQTRHALIPKVSFVISPELDHFRTQDHALHSPLRPALSGDLPANRRMRATILLRPPAEVLRGRTSSARRLEAHLLCAQISIESAKAWMSEDVRRSLPSEHFDRFVAHNRCLCYYWSWMKPKLPQQPEHLRTHSSHL